MQNLSSFLGLDFSSLEDSNFSCIEYFYITNLKHSHIFYNMGMLIKSNYPKTIKYIFLPLTSPWIIT